MDTTNAEYFDCLCRTCLQEVATNQSEQKWRSIFDKINFCDDLCIAELLNSTIQQTEVQQDDELPNKICVECLQQLQTSYQFQQMVMRSEERMRVLIEQRNKSPITYAVAFLNDDEIIANKVLKQPECKTADQQALDFAPATDPLQDNATVMEQWTVKNEPCHDDSNIEDNDDETPLSQYAVKNQLVNEENLLVQATPAASQHIKKHLKQHEEGNKQCDKPAHDMKADVQLANNVCDICAKKCKSKRSLTYHKKKYHAATSPNKPKKQWRCDFCTKSYNRCDSLKVHLRTHTGERPFLCPECGKAFSQAGALKQHRLRHGGDRSFECPHCPAKFACPNDVSKHKVVHDLARIKKHVCDVCGASFNRSDDLRYHKMLHSGEKPYKCDYCEMRFIRMIYQRSHMRTHTGEKPFKCKYCECAFAQSNDHMKHLRKHLGENVYRCELCPLAFRSNSEMRSHFSTHKNEDSETRERNMKALQEEEAKLLIKCGEVKSKE